MKTPRRAGILLHPTSLPGPFGIGDLGPQARAWVDFLADAGQTIWQILPLNPTGFGDSPYQCYSDFAGNASLVSPEAMAAEGLLTAAEQDAHPPFPRRAADFGGAAAFKARCFKKAFERLTAGGLPRLEEEFRRFSGEERIWLEDFSLFLALKRAHQNRPWWEWEEDLALLRPEAIARAKLSLTAETGEIAFEQFLFRRQWDALRAYAAGKGIVILGDLPIYCAQDSCEVWSAKQYFLLDEKGRPTVAAGVPPDYFSPTGQLWGNPIFRWDALRAERFAWWIRRIRAALRASDRVRLDHFRGYLKYWAVPAGNATAEIGEWLPGPGEDLFACLREAIGGLPFVAEDLGVITEDVDSLREQLGLPGMRILQFAFDGGKENPFLPFNFEPRTVVYTGTHDNDTTLGWYLSLSEEERGIVDGYRQGGDVAWDFIRMAWSSVAETAVCPLQDVLGLGNEGRMNYPGRPGGNWGWRFEAEDLRAGLAARLRDLTELYGRLPVNLTAKPRSAQRNS
ncbi:MAG: 4-alpha-glucanotransferase [Chloroflexi bacterium RBG_13_60_9]|nr:MAG: 4-alpha-glucanotransferase [Chloroflexi bacterium RBG_13_60_9]